MAAARKPEGTGLQVGERCSHAVAGLVHGGGGGATAAAFSVHCIARLSAAEAVYSMQHCVRAPECCWVEERKWQRGAAAGMTAVRMAADAEQQAVEEPLLSSAVLMRLSLPQSSERVRFLSH